MVYFTTKPPAIRIGLVVAKTLTKANGGTVTIENGDSTGITALIFLPTTKRMLSADGVESLFTYDGRPDTLYSRAFERSADFMQEAEDIF
ncbi:MAG: hypothetical protein JW765_02830 [Deltaproteobacteria bacterium]|nr:hypothetical protein [Candidatus Zymogenaceae bacterium]